MEREQLITIRPLTPGELADLYKVSKKTLRSWLLRHRELIGERVAKYYTTLQVRRIYECIGSPGESFSER